MYVNLLAYLFLLLLGMKRKEACQHLALSVLIPGLGFVLAVAVSVLIGFILDSTESALSWYTHSSLILPLYYLPTILALGAPLHLFNISVSWFFSVLVCILCTLCHLVFVCIMNVNFKKHLRMHIRMVVKMWELWFNIVFVV